MRLAGLVSWNDGERGRVPFLIELLDPGDKAVFTIQGFSEVEESPGSAAPPRTQLNLPLEDVTFPEPGRYRIRMRRRRDPGLRTVALSRQGARSRGRMSDIPWFDADSVQRLLPMGACIDLMADTQAAISGGEITPPLRSFVPVADGRGGMGIMPGDAPSAFGAKLVSLFAENPARGLPMIQGCILLFDRETGYAGRAGGRRFGNRDPHGGGQRGRDARAGPRRRFRTGAAGLRRAGRNAPRSDALRAPGARSSRVGAEHREGRAASPPVTRRRRRGRYGRRNGARSGERRGPRVRGERGHGAGHRRAAGWRTAATSTWWARIRRRRARPTARPWAARGVFTEITDFAMKEAGDILLAIEEGFLAEDDLAGEIGAVIGGAIEGRRSEDEITLYKSLGNVAQDLAAAHYVSGWEGVSPSVP